MKVNFTESAEIVLRNLSDDDRRRVWAWVHNLERWETDPFIQQQSKKLDAGGNDYLLVTNTDLRIFFTLEKESITVLDVAEKATIISSGKTSGAGEPGRTSGRSFTIRPGSGKNCGNLPSS